MLLGVFGCLALCAHVVAALRPGGLRGVPIAPAKTAKVSSVTSRNGTAVPIDTVFEFDQLIDHTNPSLGTFKQRFWTSAEFYETGPVILFTPGEVNADAYTGYLTNDTLNGQIAQQESGVTIVLEHRYYGLSNPVPNLSGVNMKFHTIQQAIDDLEYFAFNVDLPMANGANLSPDTTPWILIGGSYSGALTSWTMVNKPDVFWAGYASSAVVEAILNYWGYFTPIQEFMAPNCSADVEAVISHIDEVFSGNDTAAIQALKDNWGLGNLTHVVDVASVMDNLFDWQSLQPDSGGGTFFEFCDALEVKDGVNAPATGWGLDHALTAWGSFWNSTYLDLTCDGDDVVDCLGTFNPNQTFFTSTAVDNADRSWFWIVCNQVGFIQDGPPENIPAIVSRLVHPDYEIRQCTYMFSDVFQTIADVPTAAGIANVNQAYTGWNVSIDRLFFANGQRDPWREATVSADSVNRQSTNNQPIAIGDGFHCSDLLSDNGVEDPTILAVQNEALSFMKTWISEWTPPSKRRELGNSRLFK